MKKIVSILVIFALLTTLIFTVSSKAVALDAINVDVDKTTVRPGEEVKLTINFGVQLGAYTFDIAYDNKIFDYVSVDGGTPNDTTDKVKVVFHDSTGGTNPRENMSIIFRAKSDITTSNPTELTVTGEGFSSPDTHVTYDDITTPIVKNITVEPEYKDYTINLEYTGDIIKSEEKDMTLSYSSSMGRYYEHARLIAEATTPSGANVKLIGIEANTKAEEDIIQSGWGDPQGYKIGGKDVSQVLNVKALFSDVGEYTITLKLIDRDNSDSIIAEKEFSFTAIEQQAQVTPPETTTPTVPGTETPTPENEITNVETEQNQQVVNEQKPTQLPKTGYNVYLPMIAIVISLCSFGFYYNKKK